MQYRCSGTQNDSSRPAHFTSRYCPPDLLLRALFQSGNSAFLAEAASTTTSRSESWHDVPVIEADDEFRLHPHFAAQTFNDTNQVWILASWRHEIDQAHRTALGFNFGFEN